MRRFFIFQNQPFDRLATGNSPSPEGDGKDGDYENKKTES
jgi:hypothetical protein